MQTSSENIAGFAGMDELLKWAESGESTGGERSHAVMRALVAEVRRLRRLSEKQAGQIRHLEAQIDAYEEDAIP